MFETEAVAEDVPNCPCRREDELGAPRRVSHSVPTARGGCDDPKWGSLCGDNADLVTAVNGWAEREEAQSILGFF